MPDDSITFVFRIANPIIVRKISAVMDAPRMLDASGLVAAKGYVFFRHEYGVKHMVGVLFHVPQ